MVIDRSNWIKEPKPEPDKLISRNKAALLIANYQMGTNPYDNSDYARGYYDGLEAAFKGITEDDLSPWVPVTDWLPEYDKRYLCTVHREVDPKYRELLGDDDDRLAMVRYTFNGWRTPRHIPDWINECLTDTVTAWAPLPEVWKGGAE